MEIHQLKYILEVARQLHFTRAAEEICVGQSSLSHQIAKLEDELGVKLFDRTTRKVYLTPAGEEFVNCAQRILSEINTAKQCMASYSGVLHGTLHVGTITTLTNLDFGSIVASFHQIHPGLNLDIAQEGSYKLIEMLLACEIEIALLTMPPNDRYENIEFVHLADDEYVLLVSANHRFAVRKSIDLAEAAEEKFIFHRKDQSMYDICLQACQQAGFSPKIVCNSSGSSISFALIGAGMGIGFFPKADVRASRFSNITSVKLNKSIKKHIMLALPKRPYHAPPVVAFYEYITKWFAQQEPSEEPAKKLVHQ